MRRMLPAALLIVTPFSGVHGQAPAADGVPASKIDQLCKGNPSLAMCTARLEGLAKTKGVDLVAAVAKGEASKITPVTPDERTDCWAVFTALQDHVAKNGVGGFPKYYTAAYLKGRADAWIPLVKKAYVGVPEADMLRTVQAAVDKRVADVASARIVTVAEYSGWCKKVPAV